MRTNPVLPFLCPRKSAPIGPWAIAHRPMGARPPPRGRSPTAPWALEMSESGTGKCQCSTGERERRCSLMDCRCPWMRIGNWCFGFVCDGEQVKKYDSLLGVRGEFVFDASSPAFSHLAPRIVPFPDSKDCRNG